MLLTVVLVGVLAPGKTVAAGPPYVAADTAIEAGRYLTVLGGCNDCHTPQWGPTNGKLEEAKWLTGSPVGTRGPWGTSYARNLRLAAAALTEDQWVAMYRSPDPSLAHPPMPWENVRDMNEKDIRAMYQFITSLGPAGDPAPDFVPPDQEPKAAYRTSTVVPAKGQ